MKRTISVLLSILMIVLCVPAFFAASAVTVSAETLPAAVDLTGSIHLPPIGNQGAVGCCVSMAATYMQLTNAYSRYLHELDPSINWNPSSGNAAYCFAPRFTYNLGGANTAPVYEVLKEQGAPTQNYMAFSGGVTGYAQNNALARDWGTIDGYWDYAQQFRISDYDQVWVRDLCGDEYAVTTTTAGQALIARIKQNLNDGNVVVTGGYPDRWVTDLVTISNKGTYGKTGDKAIPYSTDVSSGGHQVSIVGYDDNITCVKNGVTLRGAFKVANSWGSWQNSGFIWLMYDALNGEGQSQYSALNVSNRIWTMDQFVFLDWRTDLNYGTPELMAKVTINTADRDSFAVKIKKFDPETGKTETYMPYIFANAGLRGDYYNKGYNFYGQAGSAKDGVITVNFDYFTTVLPAGKTADDYLWGVEVCYVNTDSLKKSTVKKVELLKNGISVYSNASISDVISSGSPKTYMLTEKKAIDLSIPDGAVLTPQNGSTFCGTPGSRISFTVSVNTAKYKISNYLNVFFNGERVVPIDGVYTIVIADGDALAANKLKIEGVVKKSQTVIDLSNYGDGFERPYGTYWLVFTVPNVASDPDLTDARAVEAGTYKYTLRMTFNGVTYDFTPDSVYDWGNGSILLRVNVADQGWFPTVNTTYNIKVEFCSHDVPVYVDSLFSVTCRESPFSDVMTAHTHAYTGDTIAVNTASCNKTGSGFKCCGTPGCKAMQAATLPLDATAHTFSSELIVTKNATSTERGEFSTLCTVCGETTFAGYFDAPPCDATGDNLITIADVTVVLNVLAENVPQQTAACDLDLNGDGIFSVKDLTYLLIVLANQ